MKRLSAVPDISCYAFADDLTVVSSTWDSLANAFGILCTFCSTTHLVLNLSKCQIWTKGSLNETYPPIFNQFAVAFYPSLLGSPIDIGTPYDDSLSKSDSLILTRAKRIARLSIPYEIAYRLFVSLVSSCYNHYALACDMRPSQCTSRRCALTSILVHKRSKWVCREALFSLVTPGHLLSPSLFLDYRHLVEYILFVQSLPSNRRDSFLHLWNDTRSYRWGPFYRLAKAAKALGVQVEDPFVLVFHDTAYSIMNPLAFLTIILFVILTDNFSYEELCLGEWIVLALLYKLLFSSVVNSFFHSPNLCTNLWFDTSLQEQSIIHIDYLDPICFPLLIVYIVTMLKK